ncbi:MAG: hypothetical protein QF603_02230 [Alphaproteobacteria bacterium]|jgi:hypothetical protein|nr:hypothetical protein [Rhodospirillaceae bacterium]MDP7054097.1 hypothetical protein [Alphaproteobacteria bacterium]MDP7227408.1 hypothetical protein [Alphaproteobacteria bacterium]MDP7461528.1 hypothetical protein [Alphaproteobacteria bacterium]MEE1557278.1 hypothetical protein [Alphaproteobacteria bacterium]|tara:strand:- start:1662 stop:1925 length:264 start_codon:yes stop_codon:yes gene_type:complete
MGMANAALVLDLVQWVAVQPRSYEDVMAAGRTSCPRLTIREDAVEQNLLRRENLDALGAMVRVTPRGLMFLLLRGARRQADRPKIRS